VADTAIEWADKVWNPTTGCDRVTPGCDNCYALTMAGRLKGMGQAKYQTDGDPRTSGPGFGLTIHDDALSIPLRWKKPRLIFVNSMSDLFHKDVPDEFIARVWQSMGAAPQHRYQILTKRHGRMRSWVRRWYSGEIEEPYLEAPVPGFPGYVVTTSGQILGKRADTRSGMRLEEGEQGHMRVRLHREGSPRRGESVLVHRAVLHAFSRAPRADEQARHLNGDAADNRWSNLQWGTQVANWGDRIEHGSGQSWSKLTQRDVGTIRSRGEAGESAYSIAKDYPVSDTQVRNVLTGRQWSTPIHGRPTSPGERRVLDCVWLGVSVEDQQRAELRIPALLDTPAAVHFLSCEPLLTAVDLDRFMTLAPRLDKGWCSIANRFVDRVDDCKCKSSHAGTYGHRIDWVIVGGESGAVTRPMNPDWVRALRDQATTARVPFLFKQWGGRTPKAGGRDLDGRTWDEFPR
jgi:protein gp37